MRREGVAEGPAEYADINGAYTATKTASSISTVRLASLCGVEFCVSQFVDREYMGLGTADKELHIAKPAQLVHRAASLGGHDYFYPIVLVYQ